MRTHIHIWEAIKSGCNTSKWRKLWSYIAIHAWNDRPAGSVRCSSWLLLSIQLSIMQHPVFQLAIAMCAHLTCMHRCTHL